MAKYIAGLFIVLQGPVTGVGAPHGNMGTRNQDVGFMKFLLGSGLLILLRLELPYMSRF